MPKRGGLRDALRAAFADRQPKGVYDLLPLAERYVRAETAARMYRSSANRDHLDRPLELIILRGRLHYLRCELKNMGAEYIDPPSVHNRRAILPIQDPSQEAPRTRAWLRAFLEAHGGEASTMVVRPAAAAAGLNWGNVKQMRRFIGATTFSIGRNSIWRLPKDGEADVR